VASCFWVNNHVVFALRDGAGQGLVVSPVSAELSLFLRQILLLMRPFLMIEGLKNLHDARYCAAVGITMVCFQLEEFEDAPLKPSAVKEIVEWLSGVECVGKFSQAPSHQIASIAEASGVARVQLPLEYDFSDADEIGLPLLFEVEGILADSDGLVRMQQALTLFPDALFLLRAGFKNTNELALLGSDPALLGRCILRYDDPDAIYQLLRQQGLQPFGFSLGAFASGADGQLDYDACDDFVAEFGDLMLA
jgi:hypothetical protein